MPRLRYVNTTDIEDAIRLGCRTMCSVFNADDNNVPFFGSRVLPEARLCFSPAHSESHVPGRHLNALLNAEDAIGIELDERSIDNHANAAFLAYSGPVALPINRDEVGGRQVNFTPHNCREGFHALYPLVRFRHSVRAREIAEASIRTIPKYWSPVNGWDYDYLEGELGLRVHRSTFVVGLGRSIGPLVKYYKATGYGAALELAIVLKDKALEYFNEGGDYNRETFGGHTHSTTCVMSSLAQLAELTRDARLMGRVKAFYDNGLGEFSDPLGWVIENSGDEAPADRGEINNSGDILETALILGRWGYSEYYDDAERILRCHILPSQLRDVSFVEDPPNPGGDDGKRAVADRHLGAFGFPAPYGHHPIGTEYVSFNMDIVGGGVGSLCEAYREVAHTGEAGHRVNLLFDHETPSLRIESPYTHPVLRVRVKRTGPLWVRVPSWIEASKINIRGASEAPRPTNGYLYIARPPLNRPITFEFPLVEREIVLRHRTRKIRVRLRGDEVAAMDNFGADLTFFDPFE
ncbi:MAG: hypothetical protein J4F39_09215 [Candidatus Latescibacteria bacterium]|nr:hypothetical protein [Candidatus Latescibacterota bacterium]